MEIKSHIFVTIDHPFEKDTLYKRYAQSLGRIILNRVSLENIHIVIDKLSEMNLHTKKESDTD